MPSETRRRSQRAAVILTAYLSTWVALDVLAGQFEVARGVSLWYPPAAVSVVLLLLVGVRWAPALVVTVLIHTEVVSDVGLAIWQSVLLGVVTAAGFGIGAWILIDRLRADPHLRTFGDVLRFGLMMCVLAPLPMAVVQVLLLDAAGSVPTRDLLIGAAGFWAGSATGIAMVAPLVLVVSRRWDPRAAERTTDLSGDLRSGASPLETAAQALTLGGAVWFAYHGEGGSLDYTYLVYAPILWIGLRGGFLRSTIAVLATNVGAVALAGGGVAAVDGGLALQFGLVSVTLLGVSLGAAVDQRRADSERSLRASLRDPLTGLANRRLLGDRLHQVMSRRPSGNPSGDPSTNGAVLFLDLDRFKQINDGLGHGAGDAVLVEVAERLTSTVRGVDTVARLGGDEFAVLLDGIHPAEVDDAARRILDALVDPIETSAGTVKVTTSVGSALILTADADSHLEAAGVSPDAEADPDHVASTEEVLHRADIALHRAKRRGGHHHVPFDVEMHEQAVLLQSRESALRRALGRHEIRVVFQPIVDVATRRVVGAEALARWTTPDGTRISAPDLVAAAEGSRQIDRLGLDVLRQACRAAADWPEEWRVAVNVSAVELQRVDYPATVAVVLAESGLAPSRLELEITETHSIEEVGDVTAALTDMGVRLVLDDFGTGFSSLSYLHDMPIHSIKIDAGYVSTLDTDPRSVGIVMAILRMAEELGLSVTAEGVETEEHLEFLRAQGCDRAQGFLLGRPRDAIPALDESITPPDGTDAAAPPLPTDPWPTRPTRPSRPPSD